MSGPWAQRGHIGSLFRSRSACTPVATSVDEDGSPRKRRRTDSSEARRIPQETPPVDDWEMQLRVAAQTQPSLLQKGSSRISRTSTDARTDDDVKARSRNVNEAGRAPSPYTINIDTMHPNTAQTPFSEPEDLEEPSNVASDDAFDLRGRITDGKSTTHGISAEDGPTATVLSDSINLSAHATIEACPDRILTLPQMLMRSPPLPDDGHQSTPVETREQRPERTMKVRADGKLVSPKVQKLDGGSRNKRSEETVLNRENTSPAPLGSKTRTTPKKLLKIRTDGTLASPTSHLPAGTAGRKQRGRPKKSAGAINRKMIVIRYGKTDQSRLATGQSIQDILSGFKAMPVPAPPSTLATRLPEPPKPTHPFFLGKLTKQPRIDPAATEKPDKVDHHVGKESRQESRTSPIRRVSPSKPATKASASSGACVEDLSKIPSASSVLRTGSFHGAVNPIWPPQGMVHVHPKLEDLSDSPAHGGERLYGPVYAVAAPKMKNSKARITREEEVLHPYTVLTESCRATGDNSRQDGSRPEVLRIPIRRIMDGQELQRLYQTRFAAQSCVKRQSAEKKVEDADELAEAQHGNVYVHPALSRLYSRIATSQTAFDRFEWEIHDWLQKHAPKSAEEILQPGREALILKDWLQSLAVNSVEIGPNHVGKAKDTTRVSQKRSASLRRKKRNRAGALDGFVVSSDEEASEMDELKDDSLVDPSQDQNRTVKRTELRIQEAANLAANANDGQRSTNAVVISGPYGCGKTAAIYAVTHELGFEVFEINTGSRRSGKDILDRVGDMSRNHLVNPSQVSDMDLESLAEDSTLQMTDTVKQDIESGRQATMNAFLKPKKGTKKPPMKGKQLGDETASVKKLKQKPQKQSVILLEEVDVLFEEDKQFWATALELIVQSKRPIIMTCTDEDLLPLENLPLFGILRFRQPSEQLATEYLSLLACNEGHLVPAEAISALYRAKSNDLRASITELQFFCQMAIGDTKGGLGWMPIKSATEMNEATTHKRVVSDGTYLRGMGWMYHKKRAAGYGQQVNEEIDDTLAVCNDWSIDVADQDDFLYPETLNVPSSSRSDTRILRSLDLAHDALSSADILRCPGFRDGLSATLDVSAPGISEKHRLSYIEGLTLLEADLLPEPAGISESIAAALRVFARRSLTATAELNHAHSSLENPITSTLPEMVQSRRSSQLITPRDLSAVFLPLSKPTIGTSAGRGPAISSFDRPISVVVEDIAPYVRSIVSYDLRLEEQRKQLDLASYGGRSNKRARTTRASRAALEGGSKANTRRERWFPANTDFQSVLGSGGTGWQEEALFRTAIDGAEVGRCSEPSRRLSLGSIGSEGSRGHQRDLVRSKEMSLFGSSPPEEPSQSTRSGKSQSLFDDDHPSTGAANSSLFNDGDGDGPSPWDMPTPKKPAKGNLVKTLLPATSVPESYVDAFDVLLEAGQGSGAGSISLAGAKELFEGSGVDADEQTSIIKIVTHGQEPAGGLSRSEFNVLVALIGLAQENEEATLDGVDERRKNLPEPSLPAIQQMRTGKVSENTEDASSSSREIHPTTKDTSSDDSPPKSQRIGRESLENLDADPWGSPALHKGHTHTIPVHNEATPTNGVTAARPLVGAATGNRTTSAFTTHSELPDSTSTLANDDASAGQADVTAGGWGSFGNPGQAGLGAGGFSGDDQGNQSGRPGSRSLGGGRTNRHIEESVTVTLLPDKEGMFLFQHRNYEVKSARRGSTVIRRYSDFVWLLDCLHKKYPFRQLPLLPPKRVALNGRHLATDSNFIEKRRRGLVRFANALVRHPVLGQEELVKMFLTVPTELAGLRKQVSSSVQEEFTGRQLPPDLEDSLPTNLLETFDTVRSGVRQSAEAYINLCVLLERLMKRNQGIAIDYLRFSHALMDLTETSESTYATDTNDVPLLNEGIKSTAKHLTTSQTLLDDEARIWDEGVLEDFKKQRDTLVGVRDMFDRRDRYAKDNIPYLERRIESNEHKLQGLINRPPNAPVKPGEQEKLEQAVRTDKQSIVDQHARGVFIKECMRDELQYFQQSQYQISKLHQDWSQERVKFAEAQADNWRALSEEVENMPTGD
ncbi:MAG: hypothetical protein Q9200_000656 [Gallowayella weberi]